MSGSLAPLVLAAAVFLATHIGLSSTGLRARLVGGLGGSGFLVVYSLISLATLSWMAIAWRMAPVAILWAAPIGVRHAVAGIMVVAGFLVFAGVSVRNPTSVAADVGGWAGGPIPGIVRITRHPVMWGIGLWALAHMAANGDAAALIGFGTFAVLAFGGTVLIDRKRAARDPEAWAELARQTSNLPFAALIAGRTRVSLAEIGWWRIAGGAALFLVLLFLHEPVIGVWPLWVG